MELACGLDQRLPIGQTLIQIILGHLNTNLLQLKVKRHHHLPQLRKVGNLISQLYEFLLDFFE